MGAVRRTTPDTGFSHNILSAIQGFWPLAQVVGKGGEVCLRTRL